MVRKGFVERQVEMLAAVVSRILGLRERGDTSGAVDAIRAGGRQLAGMDLDTLARLGDEGVLALLTSTQTGALDASRGIVAAVLLHERAGVHADAGEASAARAGRNKALTLLAELLAQEPALRRVPDLRARFDELVTAAQAAHGGALAPAQAARVARAQQAFQEDQESAAAVTTAERTV